MTNHTPVAREFIGKARAFRERIAVSDRLMSDMRDKVFDAFKIRLSRSTTLRKPECIDQLRLWNSSRLFGQPYIADLDYSKKRVQIRDLRLMTQKSRRDAWGETHEEGVSVVLYRLIAKCGLDINIYEDVVGVASFNLHALARYYQRAFHPSDDALVKAIWSVVPEAITIFENKDKNDFALSVPANGGHWFGIVANSRRLTGNFEPDTEAKTRPELDIRTFHTEIA